MKKHEITAYTLEEGDTLYYAEGNKIKKIVVRQNQLDCTGPHSTLPKDIRMRCNDVMLEPLIDNLYVKPGEKVRESENGRLVLWERMFVKELDKRAKCKESVYRYLEIETDFAVSEDRLRRDTSSK